MKLTSSSAREFHAQRSENHAFLDSTDSQSPAFQRESVNGIGAANSSLALKPMKPASRIFAALTVCMLTGIFFVSETVWGQKIDLMNLDSYGNTSTNATNHGLIWTNSLVGPGLLQEDVNLTLLGGSATNNLTN